MTPAAKTEGLWKVGQVAEFLSMSKSWVYKESESGRLPCVYIGASVRFRPEAVRRYLEQLARPKVQPLRPAE